MRITFPIGVHSRQTADRARFVRGTPDVRGSIHIVLRKESALVHVPALYIEILRRNATVGRVPVLIAVNSPGPDHLRWPRRS